MNSSTVDRRLTRWFGIGAVALISIALGAGCGTNKAADGSGGFVAATTGASPIVTPIVTPSTGGASTSAAPPTSATTATATATAPASPAPITYPTMSQAYATLAVKAWANHDAPRLAAYVNAGGASSFANLPKVGGPWKFHNCFADGDNAACTFDNPAGDRLTVDVIPADMGKPHGVTSAFVDKTEYSKDPASLVGAYVSAWQNDNLARMVQLSNASTTTKVTKLKAPDSTMTPTPPDTTTTFGHTLVTIDAVIGIAHYLITFDVDNGKLGHAHAMSLVSIV
jgi:hypothetical protein